MRMCLSQHRAKAKRQRAEQQEAAKQAQQTKLAQHKTCEQPPGATPAQQTPSMAGSGGRRCSLQGTTGHILEARFYSCEQGSLPSVCMCRQSMHVTARQAMADP